MPTPLVKKRIASVCSNKIKVKRKMVSESGLPSVAEGKTENKREELSKLIATGGEVLPKLVKK